VGWEARKLPAGGSVFFLDFYLLRKFSSGGEANFERDLVSEAFEALNVIAGQTLRFETVEKVPA
jgi:hypothetical protein